MSSSSTPGPQSSTVLAAGELRRLDHVGIVVDSIDAASTLWGDALGLDVVADEPVAQGRIRLLRCSDVLIELIQSSSQTGPLADWQAEHGEGVHHLAFAVDDAAASLQRLSSLTCRYIDAAPGPGSRDSTVAFLLPGWAGAGVLELVQAAAR